MPSSLRVLVIGGGGREHALAWRLSRDPERPEVLVAPGNEGIARSFRCLDIHETDHAALLAGCRAERVDLVVVGPEAPLAAGLADVLTEVGVAVFGASAACARLESSKGFAKEVMREAGVPTARAESCEAFRAARGALERFGPPYVVKADGLAAGKGVLVTPDLAEAERFTIACLEEGRFGPGGRRVLIEEFLEGEEASVMAVCDGEHHMLLPAGRDYKRAHDGDRGPNTGGMGAYAPASRVTPGIEAHVSARIVEPVLATMRRRGTPYRGVLYCGIMVSEAGPRVVEFNCRFGDPETQVIVPQVEGSLTRLLMSAVRGDLDPGAVKRGAGATLTVALVDEGYPGELVGGGRLEGLGTLMVDPHVMVFHAGTAWREGAWTVKGGRAAYVAAHDRDAERAREWVYQAIGRLGGSGWRCRRDIGQDADRPVSRAALP